MNRLTKDTIESNFTIFHNSIRSLRRNLETLVTHYMYLHELKINFNIIGVTETKITNSNEFADIPSIPGYVFEHVPTPLACGGAGLIIDEYLDYVILETTSNESFQALWIEIRFPKMKNVICGIEYRQHNSPENFLKYIEEAIEKYSAAGKNLCLLGNFNLCLQRIETCHHSHQFLLALQSCSLIPTIDKPTHVHRTSASLIDNIFVNNPDQVVVSGNLVTDVSDHFSQFCIFASTIDRIKQKQIKKCDFSKFYSDAFNEELATINWNSIIERPRINVDEIFTLFYKTFNNIVNKHAPIITLSKRMKKQLSKPWITKGLRISIQPKHKLFQSGDSEKYKYYRNKICSLIRLSKKSYYHGLFKNNLNDMRKTWQTINALLYRRKRRFILPSKTNGFMILVITPFSLPPEGLPVLFTVMTSHSSMRFLSLDLD